MAHQGSTDNPLLMIPGPSDVAEDVLAAMGEQVVAHYGAPWAAFYNEVVEIAKRILRSEGDLFIYAGSGHLGLDACIGSLFEPGDPVVVGCNGYFGERLAELASSQGLSVVRFEAPWGRPLAPEALRRTLLGHAEAKGVLLVHGETSTGVLNPVRELASVAKEHGCLTVVDAVSSAGLAPLEVEAWGIDACVTASQKGLGAPPGVVLVTVSAAAWEAIERRTQPIRGWSTNLAKWREFLETKRDYQPYYITMPVNVVRALRVSLEAIQLEGMGNRLARHAAVSRSLRESLRALGLEVIAPEEYALPSVTAVRCPRGVDAAEVRDALVARFGILVGVGLGPWSADVIRVGHMGENASLENAKRLVEGLKAVLEELRSRSPGIASSE